ncbi:2-aminoethanethiol dioxygenase-like [Dorcoceras hygrometricum]|uniref:cysteine dioxygenase n=1 Tax=Dorcoceras hygrometricum TaxID=472368 RepID=A0A2Z7CFD4_9LAMI|nr:2-aminoethanethiol dioxygenase-like [Dorcoceras hygrometricum]
MGMEQNGGGRKGNKEKRRQKKLSPVQRLYETCKEVFADCSPGIVPSPQNVEKLTAVLDQMTPADVGLIPNMQLFDSDRAPIITYLHLHECDRFSIGIFCLPPRSVIPLHNHPGMTVFSKLLFGKMHYKSYDWLDMNIDAANANDLQSHSNGLRLAKLQVDSQFTAPCETSILYPAHGGNMHILTAKTACAVLDVLGPPYCDPEGRHCQYYHEFPLNNFPAEGCRVVPEEEEDEYAWLMEREKPDDLYVVGVSYNGPKIAKN